MLRLRFLIVLALGFLMASAAWADEVGYVDCSNHSDATQVFGKPRRTPDSVASIPCGERFTILVYGFYFSRIQTKDGQVGYIYSSLIAVDRGATASQQTASLQSASEKTKIPSTRAAEAHVNPPPAQSRAAAPVPATSTTPVFPTPAAVLSASASTAPAEPASASSATTNSAAEPPAATVAQPDSPAAAQPAPAVTTSAPVQSAPTPEITVPASASNPPEVSAPATQATPATADAQPETPAPAAAQPDPAPAQPTPAQPAPIKPAIRPADTRETWEKPLPSARTAPLIELYGGFAFARMDGGSGYSSTNFNGALGSFGYNFKSWLQLVGDSSYNFVTVSGTKNVLYGNHYGVRYFYRRPNRFHITPFAEALIGGSRADSTISGSPTTSENCISYKVGGGIDYRPSRHWEIRLFDVDYYRTSFGTDLHQTNYWASAGVVLRLFGGAE